ncbi:MAG: AmmeMemoRadiSam system protein B [bacterium]|nr:AmmeMemoRadiSam system protein B [bacterium]
MSLVFAAITPHPPLLIPTIGKDAIKKLKKTKEAMEKLEEDLYIAKPDTILIISPHGTLFPDAFVLNTMPEYETDFREFGDLSTKIKLKGDMGLAAKVHNVCGSSVDCPTTMISESNLDHGAGVPLVFLTPHLPNIKILPIGFSNLDWKKHVEFGYFIKDQIMDYDKRVAVIASGDLSHALTSDAPAGFNAAGPEFDKKIQELLANGNGSGMLQLDPTRVEAASECGLRSLLILMGVLKGINYSYKSYSYESPFGVGYLVANLVI